MVCDISKHVAATAGDVLIVPFLNNYYTEADATVLVSHTASAGNAITGAALGVWTRASMRLGWGTNLAVANMHVYVSVFGSDKYLHKMTYVVTTENQAADAAFLDTTANYAVAVATAHKFIDSAVNGAMTGGTALSAGAAYTIAADTGSSIEVGKAGVTAIFTMSSGTACRWTNQLDLV